MTRNFGLGKRLYIIETDFGTIRGVAQEDAELFEHINVQDRGDAVRYVILADRQQPVPGWVYIPVMVLVISMIIVGLRYLFGG